jgi:solute carrier family 25 carnitine/acylcarnitine transporter 20/29
MTQYLENNYLKGAVSGMFGIIISHPVDSYKTHYQLHKNKKFLWNIKNLYKGVSSPLLGVGLEKALVFGTYNYLKTNYDFHPAASGAIAGLMASLVVTPYERIKILRQTNSYIKKDVKYLFKGLSATFTREVPGFAIYFFTYESLKVKFFKDNKQITIGSSFLFGGISGAAAWLFIYPQDRIKTIIQSSAKNITILNQIKSTYASGGLKQFYSGFSFAIMRAVLLHSGTFSMMEFLNK